MSIANIVESIDRRLAELDGELTQLNGARSALLVESKGAQISATPRRVRRPARPSYAVVPVGKLTALLRESGGLRTRELAQMTHGDPAAILALLKEQEDAGQIRRTGSRAATRWHLVTDEDRIAARAAELQRRSTRTQARKS